MLIDSHTHIGCIDYKVGKNKVFTLAGEDLIAAMKKYSVDYALVSSIEGAEFDSDGRLAPVDKQVPQLKSFKNLLQFIRSNGDSLKALLWIKPYTEKTTAALEEFITENRKYIAGFKMHPSLSRIKFTDHRFRPYLDLARSFTMPVQVHTENDGFSNAEYVADIAGVCTDIDFVMVHMGLNTDNKEAIEIIRNHDNIYGDTCEVKHENVIRAIEECGSQKILFGTDAVVHGIDTYVRYLPLIELIRKTFPEEAGANVLFKNSKRLFKD